jgi:hypothetical protein
MNKCCWIQACRISGLLRLLILVLMGLGSASIFSKEIPVVSKVNEHFAWICTSNGCDKHVFPKG